MKKGIKNLWEIDNLVSYVKGATYVQVVNLNFFLNAYLDLELMFMSRDG